MIIMYPAIIIFFGALEIKHVEVFVIGTLKKIVGNMEYFLYLEENWREKGENMEYFYLIGTLKNIFWRIWNIFCDWENIGETRS